MKSLVEFMHVLVLFTLVSNVHLKTIACLHNDYNFKFEVGQFLFLYKKKSFVVHITYLLE